MNSMTVAQRLGKNIDRYAGDTIDISGILNDCIVAARSHGWTIEHLPLTGKPSLLALTRPASRNADCQSAVSPIASGGNADCQSAVSPIVNRQDQASRIYI